MPADELNDQPLIRDLMSRELETINTYTNLMLRSQSDSTRAFFKHVIDEEKKHISEALTILRQLDPEQALILDKGGHVGLIKTSRIAANVAAEKPEPKKEIFPRESFTVGSLKGHSQI
ncbi:MAG TPA: hypothetical protein VFC63_04075 [Blastocatellia bacterium]|nr:hypothetical protein [Blastocatellia bacterium]